MLNAIVCSFSMKMVCTFYKATDFRIFYFFPANYSRAP